ncbi:hypothetical protein [Pseudobdellovibrio exovorus]|nr:hypothetical protein [Pseudobdellovibrio exovorus]
MIRYLQILLMALSIYTPAIAEELVQVEVINEALFSLAGNETSTTRDLALYKSVLTEVFRKKNLSQYSANGVQDFLLSRMAYKEAQVFSLKPEAVKISDSVRKKLEAYDKAELDREANLITQSLAWIELKENQLKDRERFQNWIDVLKRKYQLKIKSPQYR